MENENLIKTLTDGDATVVPFGEDIKEVDFSVSEWRKTYCINGNYETRNPDGSIRSLTNNPK